MGIAGAATATAKRAQMIGRRSRHKNCDTRAEECRWACATVFATRNALYSSYICAL